MSKTNISMKKLSKWDEYKEKAPDDALSSIHAHIEVTSLEMCAWYWTSIRVKRLTSQAVRGLAFILLIFGTALPILAAIHRDEGDRLLFTQWAIVLLAIAGLTQVADKVFGWPSGWMRYIVTVTTMENLTRSFQMEWAKYLVSKKSVLDTSDVQVLFELARALEQELTKLQAEETIKWVAEFNSGISLLDTMIKAKGEDADKKIEAIRINLAARLSGALEVTVMHKLDPRIIRIALDDEAPVEFLGNVWSRLNVPVGPHLLKVYTSIDASEAIERIVDITTGSVTKEQVDMPE